MIERIESWGGVPSPEELTVGEARALQRRFDDKLAAAPESVAAVDEIDIPSGYGSLAGRVYRPLGEGPAGLIVWLHGGGWVVGGLDSSDAQVRALANASGCVVLSVAYRLAPEHPFPIPLEDAYGALRWAADNKPVLGADVDHLVVGGDSAGGNLAAGVTLLARERGGPRIDFQLLVYPATCRVLDVPSRREYAEGHLLTPTIMEWYWTRYVGDDGSDPLASPLSAESLAGLPPAFVLLAECDVLRDEGRRYAERLAQDGVPVQVSCYAGMLHGFVAYGGMIDAAADALHEAGGAVRASLPPDARA